jgi:site-specific DNA-methyltransferase (adenine-specific)
MLYYENNFVTLYKGDCLEIMPELNIKFDSCITDLPYETTPIEWDLKIPFNEMWKNLDILIKENGAICLFGQEPFSSLLRCSNLKNYRYDWYWQKERLTNVFQVKRRPGKMIETISVFFEKQGVYNPQKTIHEGKKVTNKIGDNARWSITQANYNAKTKPFEYNDDGTRFPLQLLKLNRDNNYQRLHPTQKPVSLIEYLIKTYTNENDIVLDFTAGSGTTGIACMNTNRRCVLIEKEEKYCEIIVKRLKEVENEISSRLF